MHIFGVAYKTNLDNDRESPSYAIMQSLDRRASTVDLNDPSVAFIHDGRTSHTIAGRTRYHSVRVMMWLCNKQIVQNSSALSSPHSAHRLSTVEMPVAPNPPTIMHPSRLSWLQLRPCQGNVNRNPDGLCRLFFAEAYSSAVLYCYSLRSDVVCPALPCGIRSHRFDRVFRRSMSLCAASA